MVCMVYIDSYFRFGWSLWLVSELKTTKWRRPRLSLLFHIVEKFEPTFMKEHVHNTLYEVTHFRWMILIIAVNLVILRTKHVNQKLRLDKKLLISIYSNSKPLAKTRTSSAGPWELIPKKTRLKFLTLHSQFCLFS